MTTTPMIQETDLASSSLLAMFGFDVFEVLRAVGMELAIFAGTLTLALIIRATHFRSGCSASPWTWTQPGTKDKPPTSSKALKVDAAGPVEKAAAPAKAERSAVKKGSAPRAPATSASAIAARHLENITEKATGRNAAEALAMYQELHSSGQYLLTKDLLAVSGRFTPQDFYSALVQGAVRSGQPQFVINLLDDMVKAKVERPLSFYESAMKVLAGKKHYQQALVVYERLTGEGLQPSPVTLSCLISFTAEVGDLDRAMSFFEKLQATSTPSIRAYMTALRVCSKRLDWTGSLEILRGMQTRGVTIDSLILNTILATGVAAGRSEAVCTLLDEFAKAQPSIADVISYNTVLKGLAHQKTADRALQIYADMVKRGVKANGITYNTLMDAAVRCSQTDDAWTVFDQMRSAGIQPDKYTCTILMKGLHEDSTPQQLTKVLDMLNTTLPQCDAALCNNLFRSVIQVSARLGNAELLLRSFRQMKKQGVVASEAEYQLMLQALAQLGDQVACAELWKHALASRPQLSITAIFTNTTEELIKRQKTEAVICLFEALQQVASSSAGEKKDPKGDLHGGLVRQCRAHLAEVASRKSITQASALKHIL